MWELFFGTKPAVYVVANVNRDISIMSDEMKQIIEDSDLVKVAIKTSEAKPKD